MLKLLQKSYAGKVKLIYIDPPYNTGKEFVYPDNFQDNIKNYLELTGQVDGEGRKLSTNTEASGRFHTDWLNMMYPRLKLARNLLHDEGVIFISIDDNEAANLCAVCDDVFGSENFIANVIWQKIYAPKSSAKHFSEDHDYITVYAKHADAWAGSCRGPKSRTTTTKTRMMTLAVRGRPVTCPRGTFTVGTPQYSAPRACLAGPPKGRYWSISQEKLWQLNAEGRVWWEGPEQRSRP